MSTTNQGHVTLVGGGPGDPDLLTVAGLRAIRTAEVILYDHLAPVAALEEAPEGAELIDVGKIPRGEQTSQEKINEMLIAYARAGRNVVRFKGGDNYLFGRGGEEALACMAAGVEVTVIPGVTSAFAAPSLAGIPVTHRGVIQGVSVVSGHLPPDHPKSRTNWEAVAVSNTTIVVLMGVEYLTEIVATLTGAGLDPATPAAIIVDAASPRMKVWRAPVGQIAELAVSEGIQPPAITVIGAVTALELPTSP
ncbi:uroporphyrinogen-III C-methyltransferase [Propionibacterium sp. oral taxon 192 str. F0372]|uniref:uroporphyrinogen-III C-methyltransferase n=1 Tax=Propionibacterium sp. oral taxon 192 TaxID=671222 RepID=UPI000352835F|nr:uroporphyrinogen-III C-methyltransferase [Propionibacterium sp. oral taxon 192]EPH03793.1 uroporphyrinogen-III C-methyltransferase [Propionibacterium sp. oral taxon 192 str. F0372]